MPTRVLIAGVSTRAAAESAARAGFTVTAIDAFGDLDQPPGVRSVSLPRDLGRRFTPAAAARAARTLKVDAVAYLSSFDNHPGAVGTLSAGRALWGNAPAVLRRVRDPAILADALRRRGFQVPLVARERPRDAGRSWLIKPVASGGGHGVRTWQSGMRVSPRTYLQEHVQGTPCSIVFVAAAGRAVALAATRQLVGEAAFGASGFRYCGSILTAGPQAIDRQELAVSRALVEAVAEEFSLVGVGSLDCIRGEDAPYPIEVNPRWTASMELVERAGGASVFASHQAACVSGTLPSPEVWADPGRTYGKAVVFARTNAVAGDTRLWLADPQLRDVPRPGERFLAGRPVCTVLAEGDNDLACHAALVSRAARVYDQLATWTEAVA